jgi:hypothetical protein
MSPHCVVYLCPLAASALIHWDLDRGRAPSWWQVMQLLVGEVRLNRHLAEESRKWQAEIKELFRTQPKAARIV